MFWEMKISTLNDKAEISTPKYHGNHGIPAIMEVKGCWKRNR